MSDARELEILRQFKSAIDAAANAAATYPNIQPPQTFLNSGVPTGATIPYAGAYDNIPSGYLLCDGSAVSRTTYAALFAVIGEAFGAGDESTTFNLPDGGYVCIGYKAGGDYATVGDTLGYTWHGTTEEDGTANNHPDHDLAHTNTVDPPVVHVAFSCSPGLNIHAWSDATLTNETTGAGTWTGTTNLPEQEKPGEDGMAGHKGPCNSNEDTDNRQPSVIMPWIIKT